MSVLQDGRKLRVDANGRFDLDTAIAYAKALSQHDLFWNEEPGDPLDFELQATLRNYYENPMATGEDLFAMQDARNLIRYGGMRPDRDWLQFDCALSYGLVEYLRTLDMLKEHGWSASRCIPHGGHQMSLNIAAGLGLGGNESYPDLFQPFRVLPDAGPGRRQPRDAPGSARHRLRGQGGPLSRNEGAVPLTPPMVRSAYHHWLKAPPAQESPAPGTGNPDTGPNPLSRGRDKAAAPTLPLLLSRWTRARLGSALRTTRPVESTMTTKDLANSEPPAAAGVGSKHDDQFVGRMFSGLGT